MHHLIRSFVVLTLAAFSTFALAATTVPYTFTAGTPAKAAEINADFQALATAIDTLSARIDKLDGTTPLTMADLAGTYVLSAINTNLSIEAGGTGTESVTAYNASGIFTFAANGTGTYQGGETGYKLTLGNGITQYATTGIFSISWSLSGGKIVISGGPSFSVEPGGQLLIATQVEAPNAVRLMILTRTK